MKTLASLIVAPFLALAVVLPGAGCCKRPEEKTAPAGAPVFVNGISTMDLTGTYKGGWGTMHLLFIGNEARAAYDHENGLFVGQISATGIRGTWCQGSKHGTAEFKFARSKGSIALEGRWNYSTSPDVWVNDWNLAKLAAVDPTLAKLAPTAACR
jgi:hypothetical protein